jgi:hypothetical protein
MGARTEFEPLSWEEAEQNLSGEAAGGQEHVVAASPSRSEGKATPERCDRLREEVRRGTEYLEQVRHELEELRARIEDWPTYEKTCGCDPLAHYLDALVVKEREEQYLATWLAVRQQELDAASGQREHLSHPGTSSRQDWRFQPARAA